MSRAVRNHGIDEIRITEQDLEVFEQEHLSSCATVLMVDISHSMILYGEDRITPAKKIAMALTQLIQTRYPRDTLDVVLFGDDAHRVPLKELIKVQAGPYHTNTRAGLQMARQILETRKGVNKQIFMITDGKPSAMRGARPALQEPVRPRSQDREQDARRGGGVPAQADRDHHVHARHRLPAARVRAEAHRHQSRPALRDRSAEHRRLRLPRLREEPPQAACTEGGRHAHRHRDHDRRPRALPALRHLRHPVLRELHDFAEHGQADRAARPAGRGAHGARSRGRRARRARGCDGLDPGDDEQGRRAGDRVHGSRGHLAGRERRGSEADRPRQLAGRGHRAARRSRGGAARWRTFRRSASRSATTS